MVRWTPVNTLLALTGVILIVIAVIRGAIAHNAKIERGEIPKHADRRIVKHADSGYWIEQYHAHPGWSLMKRFDSLEAAKADKATWDQIRNAKKEVIE